MVSKTIKPEEEMLDLIKEMNKEQCDFNKEMYDIIKKYDK